MFDKETTEKILQGIIWLNEQLGIWSFIIPIIFAITVLYLLYRTYKNPSRKNTKFVLFAYAIIYFYAGLTIFLGKDFMGKQAAIVGSIALWSMSVLLIADIIFGWTFIKLSENKTLKIISWILIFSGIFLYPLLEIVLGFTYPRMVFFGAECPTTITLIGLMIGSIPKVNKPLFIIISINAVFTGTSVALNGATFDYMYALAGIIGIVVIIIFFKSIFLSKKN